MLESWHKHMPDIDFRLYGQGYKIEDYQSFIDACGRNERFTFKGVDPYPPPLCVAEIRDDALRRMCAGYKYVLYADDDFIFKAQGVERYRQAVEYLKQNPQCGMVQCTGMVGKDRSATSRLHVGKTYFWTARGLMIRNLHKPFLQLNGPIPTVFADALPALYYWSRGYYVVETRGCTTRHNHAWLTRDGKSSTAKPEGLTAYFQGRLGIERPLYTNSADSPYAKPILEISSKWFEGWEYRWCQMNQHAIDIYLREAKKRFGYSAVEDKLRELGYSIAPELVSKTL